MVSPADLLRIPLTLHSLPAPRRCTRSTPPHHHLRQADQGSEALPWTSSKESVSRHGQMDEDHLHDVPSSPSYPSFPSCRLSPPSQQLKVEVASLSSAPSYLSSCPWRCGLTCPCHLSCPWLPSCLSSPSSLRPLEPPWHEVHVLREVEHLLNGVVTGAPKSMQSREEGPSLGLSLVQLLVEEGAMIHPWLMAHRTTIELRSRTSKCPFEVIGTSRAPDLTIQQLQTIVRRSGSIGLHRAPRRHRPWCRDVGLVQLQRLCPCPSNSCLQDLSLCVLVTAVVQGELVRGLDLDVWSVHALHGLCREVQWLGHWLGRCPLLSPLAGWLGHQESQLRPMREQGWCRPSFPSLTLGAAQHLPTGIR